MATDTSPSSWGAVWQGGSVQGTWDPPQHRQNINVLELQTIYLALKHFLLSLKGRNVLGPTDSTSAVFIYLFFINIFIHLTGTDTYNKKQGFFFLSMFL